jgi:ferredoxin
VVTEDSTPVQVDGFEVRLHRSGRTIAVPPGESILDILLDAGVNVAFSCTEGVCGTCETKVIDGIPNHRDSFLTDEEKAENSKIMICCSRSKAPVLTLDL